VLSGTNCCSVITGYLQNYSQYLKIPIPSVHVSLPCGSRDWKAEIENVYMSNCAQKLPDEVYEFFSIYLILQAIIGPGDYSASNRNMFLGSRTRPMRRTDNPTAIYEPIV
jgi:hypothetical protein